MSRRSARLSRHRAVNSIESNVLDPDTNNIGDEQTHWWRNLDEITFLPRSSLYIGKNETARHLNSISQLNSSDIASEKWWENLDQSDNGHTASTSQKRNISAGIVKMNVLDTSTSDSEKEDVKKRKTRLKATNRKSSGNVFLNALNNSEISNSTRILRPRLKNISASDTLATNMSPEKSRKSNEDSSDASLTMTVLKSKTNIFDRKKKLEITNENIFQNVLSESDNSDNASNRLVIAENESPVRQQIDEDEDLAGTSQSLKLSISRNSNSSSHDNVTNNLQNTNKSEMREANIIINPNSNISSRLRNSIEKNVSADIVEDNTVNKSLDSTDKSDKTNIVTKPKSGFLSHLRKSIENNAFANILGEYFSVNKTLQSTDESSDETNVIIKRKSRLLTHSRNLSKDNVFSDNHKNDSTTNSAMSNLNKKIDIHQDKPQSLDKSLSPSAKESVNKSKNKTETIYENVIAKATRSSIRRDSTLLSSSKKHSLNISAQDQNNTKKNSTELSSDINSSYQSNPSASLPYPQFLKHLRGKRRSLSRNLFEEISQHEKIISPKKSNTVVTNVQVRDKNFSTDNTMPSLTEINETNQIIQHNDSYDYTGNEQNLTTPVKSNLNQSEKIHSFIRLSPRKQSSNNEISKIANIRITDVHSDEIEENNDINENSDVNNTPQVSRFTSTSSDISTNEHINSAKKLEKMIVNNNIDTSLTGKTFQQDTSLSKSKTTNMSSHSHNLSRTSIIHNSSGSGLIIEENKKIASRQQSKSVFQNQPSTSIKALNNNISHNINKTGLSNRTTLDNFFKAKTHTSTDKPGLSNDKRFASSNIFGNAKITEQIRKELQNMKKREIATMKATVTTEKKQRLNNVKNTEIIKKLQGRKLSEKPAKVIDKAFLVNGKKYKPPRLPRPKFWVTNRLYKFLWKHMESKYKLSTRVKSEKFIERLTNVVSVVQKFKHYKDYKHELETLMMEMARLGIIRNRNEFYHFCQDFMPYDFRIKAVPMLLPGNKSNIPYKPELLHTPLLNTE